MTNDDANADPLKHNVLQNDSDPDTGTTLVVSGTRPNGSSGAYTAAGSDVQGTYGKLHLNADGSYSYTVTDTATTKALGTGQTLSDVFQYQIADGNGGTATAKVTIAINGVNDDPTAVNDANSLTVAAGTGAGSVTAGTASRVLLNDSDPDTGTTLVVAGARPDGSSGAYTAAGSDVQGTYGALHLNADGTYTYTYTVTDTATTKALGTGQQLSDVFQYQVSDGNGGTATAKVTITINGVNDTPIATDNSQSFTVAKGTGAGSVSNDDSNANALKHNVLQNDSDSDTSDTLSVSGIRVTGAPSFTTVGATGSDITDTYGTLHINKDGSYTYTLSAAGKTAALALPEGQSLADRVFDYQISDGHGGSATAKLTISVTGVNDDPAGANKTLTINEDATLTLTAANFGFSDPDTGNTLQGVKITSLPTHGQLLLNGVAVAVNDVISPSDIAASKLTFVPVHNESGTSYDLFNFAVYDGLSYDPTPNKITINVTAVADKPDVTAPASAIAAVEDTPVAISGSGLLTAVLTDTDGSETLTLKIKSVPAGATFNTGTDNHDGSWSFTAAQYNSGLTFTPPPQASGTYNMTWEATSTEASNGSAAVSSATCWLISTARNRYR